MFQPMAISAGLKLGPYEIIAPLGAGGMGEVYSAKDPRLGRQVAIKILPSAYAADSLGLQRFEQEARAAAQLNHPNIVAIHDIGTSEGAPYVVMELLEGETLRQRIAEGPLPVRKVIDYAIQIALGLAAAHDHGIVHRDLKPENIFITSDGRVKILDFGLARVIPGKGIEEPGLTISQRTDPGTVLGTMGYMSPEQVRGKPADQRSDIFSLGVILHEALTGKRAFHGDSSAEVMSAILREEPSDLSALGHAIAPALDRILRHCLEKKREQRFQSAHDLAFDLQVLSTDSGQRALSAVPDQKRRWLIATALAVAGVVASLLIGYFAGKSMNTPVSPKFHQLTFRRGTLGEARFTPDGQTVIYSAAWEGKPAALFTTRTDSVFSRTFGMDDADVLSISRSGEMAVSLGRISVTGWQTTGMLARTPLAGGAPREMLDGVQDADWNPDGDALVITRLTGNNCRLEYPPGHLLYETSGWVSHPRISPDGKSIAFFDHPLPGDNRGAVALLDLAHGRTKKLSDGWAALMGLAWSPSGKEVWFSGSNSGANTALFAVTTKGQLRQVLRIPSALRIHDIFRDGRVLISQESMRRILFGLGPGESKERELTWLDWGLTRDLSADGKLMLFGEEGEGGGANYSVYVRKTDGSDAIRLGDGNAWALSRPDAKWALATPTSSPAQIMLLPTGPGEPRQVTHDGLEHLQAGWFPDGKHIVFIGREPGRNLRTYLQDLEGGEPRPVTPDGVVGLTVSPDGKLLLARGEDRKLLLYPLGGGTPVPLAGAKEEDIPIAWGSDNQVYLTRLNAVPAPVVKLDPATGRRTLWREFAPPDRSGVRGVGGICVTPDGKYYIYGVTHVLADLYVVDGLR
jgi:eukaryotic-like serine/threonine-protein kinase